MLGSQAARPLHSPLRLGVLLLFQLRDRSRTLRVRRAMFCGLVNSTGRCFDFMVGATSLAVIHACLRYLPSLVDRGCPGAVVELFTCVCSSCACSVRISSSGYCVVADVARPPRDVLWPSYLSRAWCCIFVVRAPFLRLFMRACGVCAAWIPVGALEKW